MKTSDKVGTALGLVFGVGNFAVFAQHPGNLSSLLLACVGSFCSFYGAIRFFTEAK